MTVAQLIKKLEKIKNKDRLIVVNDKVSDEYVIATQAVKQDSLGIYNYNEDIMDVEEIEVDCVVIE